MHRMNIYIYNLYKIIALIKQFLIIKNSIWTNSKLKII